MADFDITQRSLPLGALDGQMGAPLSDIRLFERWLNAGMRMTMQESHVYVDFTSGDDTVNDGLSASTPVKTWDKVLSLIPDVIAHDCVIHCVGTSSEFGSVYINKHVLAGVTLYIAGEDDWTTVDDNGGAHYVTAGGTGVAVIVENVGGLTPDEFKGHFVYVIDGPAAGDYQMLQGNTAANFVPVKNFPIDPTAAGILFDVVRPKTTLASSVVTSVLYLNTTGGGTVRMQQFSLTGTKCYVIGQTQCQSRVFSHIDIVTTATHPLQIKGSDVELSGDKYDVTNGSTTFGTALISAPPILHSHGGVGFVSATTMTVQDSAALVMGSSTLGLTVFANCRIGNVYRGTRFNGAASFSKCRQLNATVSFLDTAGYAATQFDNSAGVGVIITEGSHLNFTDIDLSDATSHGVDVTKHSSLTMLGVVTGVGNTGAGAYAHDHATVHITNGSTPTLTGTVGDFAVSDPTAQENTWANVDAGVDVAIAARMALVREV